MAQWGTGVQNEKSVMLWRIEPRIHYALSYSPTTMLRHYQLLTFLNVYLINVESLYMLASNVHPGQEETKATLTQLILGKHNDVFHTLHEGKFEVS